MAINAKMLPSNVQNDLMDSLDIDYNQDRDKALAILADKIQYDSVKSIFSTWLEYNGIIGYTESIIDAWEKMNEAAAAGRIEAHH